jgi:asparagine synthase (glutamine-hydrolysing)
MCGIAGEFVFEGDGVVAADRVVPMLRVLAHRGPDEWGYWVDDHDQAMLLHARLSIVDLSGGQQPMSNEDGTVWTIVNGELYGHEEIADDLRARGHRFATRSDSEIVVHLYEEYGEDFVQHLRGEFAVALYDRRQHALCLARDRFGIKPLYYTVTGGHILFASEIKALLCHPLVTAQLDDQTVYSLIATIAPPGDTLFRGIRQLEPGCMLTIADGRVARHAYWHLQLGGRPADGNGHDLSEQEAVAGFRERLFEATRLRLHGDVETGAYLSGGIDSAAVAAIAARFAPGRMKAFTIGFGNPAYDETPWAAALARHAGLEHYILPIGPQGLVDSFQESLWHTELPVMNAHGAAKFLLSQLAGKYVKVVLTGEGADEMLMGYAQFHHHQLLDRLAANPRDRVAREALKRFLGREGIQFGVTTARHYEQYDRVMNLFGAYPYPLLRMLHSANARRLVLAPDFVARTKGYDPALALAERLDRHELKGLHPLAATQYVLFKTDLAGYILNILGDRAEMAHSVEGRVPFLDHHVVEYVGSLPPDLLAQNECCKHLLREAVRDLLPDEVLNRRKKQFMSPSPEVLGLHRHNPMFDHYLSAEVTRRVGVFRPAVLLAVRRMMQLSPRGSYVYGLCEGVILYALSLHMIHDMFCESFRSYAERYTRVQDRPLIRQRSPTQRSAPVLPTA